MHIFGGILLLFVTTASHRVYLTITSLVLVRLHIYNWYIPGLEIKVFTASIHQQIYASNMQNSLFFPNLVHGYALIIYNIDSVATSTGPSRAPTVLNSYHRNASSACICTK